MVCWLIRMDSSDGLPLYYDPGAGRNTGHGFNGWSQDKEQALGFAAQHDAQRFIDAMLLRNAASCRPVVHTRTE